MTLGEFVEKTLPTEDNECTICVRTGGCASEMVWKGDVQDIPFQYTRCELENWHVDDLNYHQGAKQKVPCWGIEFTVIPKSLNC